jgi:hypothetical protein
MPTRRVVQFGKSIVCVVRYCELPGRCRVTDRQVQVHFAVGVIDEIECLPRQVALLWDVVWCFQIQMGG